MDKKALRKHLRGVLAELKPAEKLEITSRINLNISNLLKDLKSQNFIENGCWLGCYSPLPDEFDWHDNDEISHFKIALPHLLNETQMCFVPSELNQIKSGFMGLELAHYAGKRIEPDILFVPGLGFSSQLERIGRGKGYYDRFLQKCPNAIKVGICSERQLVDSIPTDKYDIKMNYVITDQKIY